MSDFWSDLVGISKGFLRLGKTGPRIKDSSGALAVRNAGDSADADVKASLLFLSGDDIVINDGAAGSGNDWELTLSRNALQTANTQFIFPPAKGTDGYVLRQKAGTGSGIVELEFASAGSTDFLLKQDTTTLAFGDTSPKALFTMPNDGVIDNIRVIVDTAFNGTSTLSIGISGSTSKYAPSTDIDLTTVGQYEIHPGLPAEAVGEALIGTYSAGGASAGSARIIVSYSVPA